MLDFIDEAFNPVSQTICVLVVSNFGLARLSRRDHHIDLGRRKIGAKVVVVEALIGNQG
jgi:hypothetical protein